jgi:serine/alanine adding enzyme
MTFLSDNQIDKNKWLAFFLANPFSSPFQSPDFFQLFNSIPNLSARVFAIEQNHEIKALCVVTFQKEKGIKGYFSRRAIIYGGPLLPDNDNNVSTVLLKHINTTLKSSVIYTEVRNLNDYSNYLNCFFAAGFRLEQHLNFQLNCTSEEIVWANMNTNRKRQIKKALKSGVVIQEAKTEQEIIDYYQILNNLYQNKIKKPLFELNFFKTLFKNRFAIFLLVKWQDKIIGGIVCPVLPQKTIYEFYICGLDNEYKELSPSVMATFAAIEYGYKNNLKTFDFMGAGKPDEDYGVRDFKAKFGGELVTHGRFLKINQPFLYSIGKLALYLINKTK